jgi:hypothetical protein
MAPARSGPRAGAIFLYGGACARPGGPRSMRLVVMVR